MSAMGTCTNGLRVKGKSGDVKRRRSTKRRGKHKNKRNGEELE
jgi:hypothetical protein